MPHDMLWRDALELLRQGLGPAYAGIAMSIVPLSINGGQLVLRVRDSEILEYSDRIAEAVRNARVSSPVDILWVDPEGKSLLKDEVKPMTAQEIWAAAEPLFDADTSLLGSGRGLLGTAKPFEFDGRTFTIAVTTQQIANMLESRHHASIVSCLSVAARTEVEVVYRPDEGLKQEVAAQMLAAPVYAAPRQTAEGLGDLALNNRFSLSRFHVADCNGFAHAAVQQVIRRPGLGYNPLFIHSKAGLGKTHLMQGLGLAIQEAHPDWLIVYTPAEFFVNDLREAFAGNATAAFRSRYRHVNVWLVDDIGFLTELQGGGSKFEDEFFHTANTLWMYDRQVVVASEDPPKGLRIVNDRLRSRLEMGILADMRAPDLETRIAILQMRAEEEGVEIPLDLISLVARKVEANIRVLEGALTTLCAWSTMPGAPPLTEDRVDELIAFHTSANDTRRITLLEITEYVGERFSCPVADITGPKRSQDIAWPRQVAMYLAREMTDHSLSDIGSFFGDRDHSTVLYGYNKVKELVEEDEQTLWLMGDCKAAIRG